MADSGLSRVCASCGSANPADHSICFICGRALGAAQRPPAEAPPPGAPTMEQRQAYRASMADEAGVVRLLRLLYFLYAVGYLLLMLAVLVFAELLPAPGSVKFLAFLFPAISLVLVVVAIRRTEEEPFAWALVMAGMETLAFLQVLLVGGNPTIHAIAAGVLWLGVLACVRTTGIRLAWASGSPGETGGISDVRLVGALFLLYGGVLGLLYLTAEGLDDATHMLLFWGGIVLLGLAAGVVAGGGVLKDSLRFGVRASHLKPTLLGIGVALVIDTVLLTWAGGDWFPGIPELAMPDPEWMLWVVLAPSLFEEWLCRGVMWSLIRERASTLAVVIATATLFALMHGGLSTVLPQLFAGVIFGVLRAKTGSLVPSMVVHAVGNFYIGACLA